MSIAGLYGYFSSIDRDGSGLLEKDEVECKFQKQACQVWNDSEKKVTIPGVILISSIIFFTV